jgi:hypothetical protein
MIRLDTWLREGARHPQRTRLFTMAIFAVPVREQVCTTKEGRFEDKKSNKIDPGGSSQNSIELKYSKCKVKLTKWKSSSASFR